jgi:hypothetical protein
MSNWEEEQSFLNEEPAQNAYESVLQTELPPRKGSGMAVASLVLGIVGVVFVCCFFGFSLLIAVAGLAFGIISLIQNRKGTGMAVAGTVLNGITLVITILLLTVVILFNVGLRNVRTPNVDVIYDGLPIEWEQPESIYEEDVPARL